MSKTLATIDTRAEIDFDLDQARFENPYTKEAHDYFQRLQFKNLLSRFDVEADTNAVEDYFQEITQKEELERIFAEGKESRHGRYLYFRRRGKCAALICPCVGIRQDRNML